MKKKLASLMMVTSFLFLMFFGLGLAMADDDPGPNCDVTVSSGESIQDFIDAAAEGDVICVEPGTYTEDLIIEQGLELAGLKDADDDDNSPIIKGVATVPGIQFPLAEPNIDIQANDVSIHGFIIESPEVATDEYSSGIVLTGRNIRIYDNHFVVATGDVSQAIQTWRQDNAPEGLRDISGLRIYKNSFTHLELIGLGAYEGIFINPQSDVFDLSDPASAVRIEKNNFSGALIRAITTQRSATVISKNRIRTDWEALGWLPGFPRGIQLSKAGGDAPADSTGHKVIKNKIEDKGGNAFSVGILVRDEVEDCAIEKNKITGAIDNGIDLESSVGHSVEKNQIKYSIQDGIFAGGNDNKIIKNIIRNCGNDGLIVEGVGNTLTKNIIQKSGEIGIYLGSGSAGNSIVKNKVKKSEYFDIVDGNDNVEDNDYEKNICRTSDPEDICRKSKKK